MKKLTMEVIYKFGSMLPVSLTNKIPKFLKEKVVEVHKERKLEQMKKIRSTITKGQILGDLRKLGLKEGDIVLVHSSLSSIGYVEGGADTVIDALLRAVGDKGTILMPAFSYHHDVLTTLKSGVLFDPKDTPSSVGVIAETFRLRKEALRSLHPIHSVTAIGPQSKYLLKDHNKSQTPYGRNSPFYKLIVMDGYILHLGSSFGRTTSVHVIESLVDNFPIKVHIEEPIPARYLDYKGIEHTTLIKAFDPEIYKTRIDHDPEKEKEIYNYCLEYGAVVSGKVGEATSHLISARKLEEVLEMLLVRGITIY